ncbi:MAG: hypothetical protein U0359_37905 [Byssovorax sp.]
MNALRPAAGAPERMAAILALPLREEPETDEERALFAEAEADLRDGRRGLRTDEILGAIAATRDTAAE